MHPQYPSGSSKAKRRSSAQSSSGLFHFNWESQINWEGAPSKDSEKNQTEERTDDELRREARAIVSKPRNPYLQNPLVDDTTICWNQEDARKLGETERASLIALNLDMQEGSFVGSAKRDEIRQVELRTHRPRPAAQEEAYQARLRREQEFPSKHVDAVIKGPMRKFSLEYIEQPEMVRNHSMVRLLGSQLIRQYHRPKLPRSIIKLLGTTVSLNTLPMPNSIIRESDLSPSYGHLVLLEYSEERPPIQLGKGMRTKIINFFRGDPSDCPTSVGGGDKPRMKSTVDSGRSIVNVNRRRRLQGPDQETVLQDWLGEFPRERMEPDSVFAEGVTEILSPNDKSPFIAQIKDGTTVSALVSNLFVAPIFQHKSQPSDYLMIFTSETGEASQKTVGVVLRNLPGSVYCVGQTEPREKVRPPEFDDIKILSYRIAKYLANRQQRGQGGAKLPTIRTSLFSDKNKVSDSAFRKGLGAVAKCHKGIWIPKTVGVDDGYDGLEVLGKKISPEALVLFETTAAARLRLHDLGLDKLVRGDGVKSVRILLPYLAVQMHAAKKLLLGLKSLEKATESNQDIRHKTVRNIKKATQFLQREYEMKRNQLTVARFIHDELHITPWNITRDFLDIKNKTITRESVMMQLSGLGDPSGCGNSYSFLRSVEKPTYAKADKKILHGTDADLRGLRLRQLEYLLLKLGVEKREIKKMPRWPRTRLIWTLAQRAVDDGVADAEIAQFARTKTGTPPGLSNEYQSKIQYIWQRQIHALSQGLKGVADTQEARIKDKHNEEKDLCATPARQTEKRVQSDDAESESDDEDDFLFNEMATVGVSRTQLGQGMDDKTFNDEDAKDFESFMTERREADEARRAFSETEQHRDPAPTALAKRKVIKQKITTTKPDGTHTTVFRFICDPDKSKEIIGRLGAPKKKAEKVDVLNLRAFENPPGHFMFEDGGKLPDVAPKPQSIGKVGRVVSGRRPAQKRSARQTGRGSDIGRSQRHMPKTVSAQQNPHLKSKDDLVSQDVS